MNYDFCRAFEYDEKPVQEITVYAPVVNGKNRNQLLCIDAKISSISLFADSISGERSKGDGWS